jgi:ABC-type transport system substrate-binding protein
LRALTALAAALAALSGCGSRPKDTSTLHLAQTAEPTTLDPAQVQDGPTIDLLSQVYNGLIQWTKENKLVPALAERWDVSNGGRTYTFHLRKGVKFHNGRPVTARDFVYSLTRSLDSHLPYPQGATYLNDIVGAGEYYARKAASVKGIEAPDDATLRLTIDAPKAYFLAKLTYPTAYAVCKEEIQRTHGSVTESSMIGTGPFKLVEYRHGDRLVLQANPDYYEGAPRVPRMERRILLQDDTRHAKFAAGELDISDVSMAMYRADRRNAKLQPLLHQFERPSVYYLALNQKAFAPFKDRRVRQAFARAVNKSQIISTVHEGVPRLAEGILPYGIPGFDPRFKGLQYDPEAARKLLAEAGYPGGKGFPALTLSYRASVNDIGNTATAVQEDLQKNLGISVRLDETEWGKFLNRRQQGEMPFYFLRWAADYLDPQNFLSTMLHSKAPLNTLGYANPQFDLLCDQADLMQDETKRMATYRQAEAIAVQDAPWIPVYFQKDVELWSPRLQGVEDSLMGHLPYKRAYFAP